uniref:Cytochrome c-type biogenesis protein CcmH n=1 Tax=Candidatus Kentrum sp. LFY TaxID=2126342 RepID=A0A450UJX4_9GAMM|nr:MAG: cytochrome c-type biogenesis protein CcmH [Candidatus Kentron sp. LFY]
MIGTFLSITTVMTGIGLAFVLPTMLGGNRRVAYDRALLNAAIHRERLLELEQQHRDKRIDDAEFARFRNEIRQSALSDLEGNGAPTARQGGTRSDKLLAVFIAIALPAVAFGLYFQLGNPALLVASTKLAAPEVGHRSVDGSPKQPSVEEMVARLASRLREAPDDPEGWLMLGRSYVMLGRLEEARASLAEAFQRWPNNPEILVSYAKLLARDNDGGLEGRPFDLIESALRIDPDYPPALWLAGIAAYQRKQYANAVRYWEALQKKGGIGEQEQEVLAEFLGEARRMMASQGGSDRSR